MSGADLAEAAERNGFTLAEYAEQYAIRAGMERANAHLRRRYGAPSDLRDARICARLAGRYLARAHTLGAYIEADITP